MVKKNCSAGQKWDTLVNDCVSREKTLTKTEPPTEPPLPAIVDQVRNTAPATQVDAVTALSPALWIFVVLATVGSILVLALWFVIYRRQTRPSSTPGEAEPGQESLQKTEPKATIHPLPSERNGQEEMFLRAAEAVSPCAHLHLGAQRGSEREEGFIACRGHAKHAGEEAGRGQSACSTMREHNRLPLPATELGGTALVTTKTV
ncbi:Hypothetical protein SMAX5B_005754 [Scophthalmus maximus]|uniref:Tumor necrosis factor receptor superfamily member 13C-like n=1 Tax=Scophthalmus maximus TaxID=52904 RepID=A0A2U9CRY0_SCOMX|nr:uncharacterized protein LOC118288645 [Scophthalmus maximus]AWP18579.1 Hypothetical protein SMAX5B_005754 [Scophthalmus maximus]